MSIFSRLFGGSKNHVTRQGFEEVTEQTRKQMQPVDEISHAILKAAAAVRGAVEPILRTEIQGEDSRRATEMAVFYQSIYFMRAVTMQVAHPLLESSQFDRFADLLDALLASVAVSSYYQVCSEHFPQDLKDRLIRDYYECGEAAELEFRECTKSDSGIRGKERFTAIMLALQLQTAENVSLMLSKNGEHYTAVMSATTAAAASSTRDIFQAVAKLAKADLPCVDTNDLLRHLMGSTKH